MRKSIIILIVVLFFFGCVSTPIRIPGKQCAKLPKEDLEVLGYAEGSSTGIMLFQFIPIGQNDRYVKAYNEAVDSLGGDCLLDAQISERWFWAYVLNGYIAHVSGNVVKQKIKNVPSENVSPEKVPSENLPSEKGK